MPRLNDDQVYAVVRALQVAQDVYRADAVKVATAAENRIERAFVDQAGQAAFLEELFANAETVDVNR